MDEILEQKTNQVRRLLKSFVLYLTYHSNSFGMDETTGSLFIKISVIITYSVWSPSQ